MGQPSSTAAHRVPGGEEPRSQGAADGAARSVDRRPAPTARGEGPATWSPRPEAGGDHRDARHDPAVAPAADRREVDVRAEAAGASRDHEVSSVILRMATENPAWGYSRIQGALKNLDHRVARSTVAKGLKDNGIPPVPGRPTSWRTFLRAHWGEIAGADFISTEVWMPRGLVTYYTLFVLDLRSRRVHVVGSTPNPDAAFMAQAARCLTDAVDGFLTGHRVLICDRDGKWTDGFRGIVEGSGVRVVLTPFQAPNANAYAERFVRSIREECLDRLILFGERRLLRVLDEFVAHYHGERNHQGLGNDLITPEPGTVGGTHVRCRERLGGLLRYYHRVASAWDEFSDTTGSRRAAGDAGRWPPGSGCGFRSSPARRRRPRSSASSPPLTPRAAWRSRSTRRAPRS